MLASCSSEPPDLIIDLNEIPIHAPKYSLPNTSDNLFAKKEGISIQLEDHESKHTKTVIIANKGRNKIYLNTSEIPFFIKSSIHTAINFSTAFSEGQNLITFDEFEEQAKAHQMLGIKCEHKTRIGNYRNKYTDIELYLLKRTIVKPNEEFRIQLKFTDPGNYRITFKYRNEQDYQKNENFGKSLSTHRFKVK
jgi:hypothetical protein